MLLFVKFRNNESVKRAGGLLRCCIRWPRQPFKSIARAKMRHSSGGPRPVTISWKKNKNSENSYGVLFLSRLGIWTVASHQRHMVTNSKKNGKNLEISSKTRVTRKKSFKNGEIFKNEITSIAAPCDMWHLKLGKVGIREDTHT